MSFRYGQKPVIVFGRILKDKGDEVIDNWIYRWSIFERKGEAGKIGEIDGCHLRTQVGFIQDDERFFVVLSGQKFCFFVREGAGAIHKAEAQVRLRKGVVGSTNAFLFNFARSLSQTGRIDYLHRIAPQGDGFFNRIARGAGKGRYNGAVASGQTIEQRGFADVRGSCNDDPGTFTQDSSLVPSIQQGPDVGGQCRKALNQFSRNRLRQFIIWKIKHGFDIRRGRKKGLIDGLNAQADGIFQLSRGQTCGPFGAGMDEVQNGFGLCQIQFIIQEGSLGEFAGFGLACSRRKESMKNALGDLGAAMALNFNRIFAGIGMGGTEKQAEGLIETLAGGGIHDGSMGKGAGRTGRGWSRGGSKQEVGQEIGFGAGYSDNGNGSFAGGSGDGCNGVGWIGERHVRRLIHPKRRLRNSGKHVRRSKTRWMNPFLLVRGGWSSVETAHIFE